MATSTKTDVEKMDYDYVVDVFENFSFNQNYYKKQLKSMKSSSENSITELNCKHQSAIALNDYVENNLNKSKIRLANSYIKKINLKWLTWIISLLFLSFICVISIIGLAFSGTVVDWLVLLLTTISAALLITTISLIGTYLVKVRKINKDKAKYFRKQLTTEISFKDMTKLVFNDTSDIKFNGVVEPIKWVSMIKNPDVPEGYTIVTDTPTIQYEYYGMKVNIQDAKLVKSIDENDSKTGKKAKDSLLGSHVENILLVDIQGMKDSKFSGVFLPFTIYNKFNFFDAKNLDLFATGDVELDSFFKFKTMKSIKSSKKIMTALKALLQNVPFNNLYYPTDSGIYCNNHELKALFALTNKNNDKFYTTIKTKEFKNTLGLSLPKEFSLNDKMPLWMFLDNFYIISDYIGEIRSNFYKYILPIVHNIFQNISETPVNIDSDVDKLVNFQ